MSNQDYMKSLGIEKIEDDWALQNAIEIYHAYLGKDKGEVIELYANALRKGYRIAQSKIVQPPTDDEIEEAAKIQMNQADEMFRLPILMGFKAGVQWILSRKEK